MIIGPTQAQAARDLGVSERTLRRWGWHRPVVDAAAVVEAAREELVRRGVARPTQTQVAHQIGVSDRTLRRWVEWTRSTLDTVAVIEHLAGLGFTRPTQRQIAEHLGVSDRTLRRVGVAPVAVTSAHRRRQKRRADARRRERAAGVTTVVRKQSDRCAVCGDPIDRSLSYPDPMSYSIGHEPPLFVAARDGMDTVAVRPEHLRCNVRKGPRSDMEMSAS